MRNLLKRLDYEYIILYFKPNAKSNERHRTSYAAQREHMRKDGFVMLVSEHEYYEELMAEFEELNPIMIYSLWGDTLMRMLEKAYIRIGWRIFVIVTMLLICIPVDMPILNL